MSLTITADSASTASTTVGWSVDTLAAHMRGIVDGDSNASGGSVPDRVKRTCREWGAYLYNQHAWRFRSVQGTLTVASGASTATMAADFDKLDQQIMRVNDTSKYQLLWTEEPSTYQRGKDMFTTTATGPPQLATYYWDESSAAWIARVAPEADDAYSYLYWYLRKDPWHRDTVVGDSTIISTSGYWPHTFDAGWELLVEAKLLKHYRSDESWVSSYRGFKNWLDDQKASNDRTQATRRDRIEDVMQHQLGTMAGRFAELPGFPAAWLGVAY